ncbi:MAG: F0F1 ATP synthase subunit B [Candidatus Omnitrophota bacterium]|nr:F0F1 ATP synthase subunit B [Candidatus Omnitrophota bacterium]MDZ4243335.1 F0F1 ATP synthase subunit B [Candidatus Omnitrophota bacterium]
MADHPSVPEGLIAETAQPAAPEKPNLLNADVTVLILTWVTFFLLLAVLQKFAWKPILAALDERENRIRRSIEEAEKTRQEYEKIEENRSKILDEAGEQSKNILDDSRKAAQNLAKAIEQKAKNEAQVVLENTRRDIQIAKDKAEAQLRQESAEIAVQLAGKIIEENLDNEKNRKLIDQLIKKI